MSNQTIYDALRAGGLTHEGACGLMGNMMAESGMCAAIAQRGMTALSDAEYTRRADTGTLDFVHDAVGYGLCQWTYFSRKWALKDYAAARGLSVGDEGLQTAFCIRELQNDFPGVWAVLCASHDLYECARIVCLQYERPAVNNVEARFAYAQDFARGLSPDTDSVGDAVDGPAPDLSVLMLQALLRGNGYDIEPDGRVSAAFFAKLREFTGDMEACGHV